MPKGDVWWTKFCDVTHHCKSMIVILVSLSGGWGGGYGGKSPILCALIQTLLKVLCSALCTSLSGASWILGGILLEKFNSKGNQRLPKTGVNGGGREVSMATTY